MLYLLCLTRTLGVKYCSYVHLIRQLVTRRAKSLKTQDTPPPQWDLPEPQSPALMAGTPWDDPESWSAAPMSRLWAACSGHWAPPLQHTRRATETLAEAARTPTPPQGCRNPSESCSEQLPAPPSPCVCCHLVTALQHEG